MYVSITCSCDLFKQSYAENVEFRFHVQKGKCLKLIGLLFQLSFRPKKHFMFYSCDDLKFFLSCFLLSFAVQVTRLHHSVWDATG